MTPSGVNETDIWEEVEKINIWGQGSQMSHISTHTHGLLNHTANYTHSMAKPDNNVPPIDHTPRISHGLGPRRRRAERQALAIAAESAVALGSGTIFEKLSHIPWPRGKRRTLAKICFNLRKFKGQKSPPIGPKEGITPQQYLTVLLSLKHHTGVG